MRVYYDAGDKPFLTRKTASQGIRGWLGKHVPEEGVLVLLRGLLEDAAPAAVMADHLVTDGESLKEVFEYWPHPATPEDMSRTCMNLRGLCFVAMR